MRRLPLLPVRRSLPGRRALHLGQRSLVLRRALSSNVAPVSRPPPPLEGALDDKTSSISDPLVIFRSIIASLEEEFGEQNMRFPKELVFLGGAPGSGKGTNSHFIAKARGITSPPIVTSDLLLSSPKMRAAMEKGELVSDTEVVALLLRELLKQEYQRGAIIDGFPRTLKQAAMVTLLRDEMKRLREKFGPPFRRPVFRITVLYVPEAVSIVRQLARGRQAIQRNSERAEGEPPLEIRPTDLDENLARARYGVFRHNYQVILDLKESFHFTVIDANASIDVVRARIEREFQYQSSLELAEDTYAAIHAIPTVSQVTEHARQLLVSRLDGYMSSPEQAVLFKKIVQVIQTEFMPPIQRHVISGSTIFYTDNPVFEQPQAVEIALDILSDRGFHVMSERQSESVPKRVNLETGEIEIEKKMAWKFHVKFPKSVLRSLHKWTRTKY